MFLIALATVAMVAAGDKLQTFRQCMLRHPQRHDHCLAMAKGELTPNHEILNRRTIKHFHNHPIVDADSMRHKRRICRTPCQRHRLMITRRELADLVTPQDDKIANSIRFNPNEIIDIGQCSGSCQNEHAQFSGTLRTCLPLTYAPIDLKKDGYMIDHIIVNSCGCRTVFLC